ncbi:hypothetical protein C6P46_005613 [Rhodotorula mucilaginosa]|uniref:Zn(2)-C6 fungal-type domain-containing protein n=1 Tax=Rhodotorula mucilaginosa TaxID=5537 RepID=A0A9P6VXL4_RHOMI|nr:hypothetical protein C6P46_005613 [Rhodotorula mucilaginosa]
MPPDRTHHPAQEQHQQHSTAQRFSEAINTGMPMSSVGPTHPPSLERGRACLTCRRRRVKCDGARPVCGRCSKSARAHGEDPTAFSCDYDSQLKSSKSTKETESIAALAAEVAALKQQLADQRAYPQPEPAASTSSSSASTFRPPPTPQADPRMQQQRQQQQQEPQQYHHQQQQYQHAEGERADLAYQHYLQAQAQASPSAAGGPSILDVAVNYVQMTSNLVTREGVDPTNGRPLSEQASGAAAAPASSSANMWALASSSQDGLATPGSGEPERSPMGTATAGHAAPTATGNLSCGLADLAAAASPLYQLPSWSYGALTVSGYPSDLPSMPIMRRLVDVYFAKPHLTTGLIDEARFRASFAYPFDDPRSPVACLLHAMVATAAMMVNEETFFADEPKYWLYDGQGRSCSDYHARRAQEMLQSALHQGRHLLQIVQASVLCVFCAYTNARWSEIWIQSAECSRLAVCVDLIHVRAADPDAFGDERDSAASSHQPGGRSASTAPGGRDNTRSSSGPKRQRRFKDKSILHPTMDPDELAERCAVFWFVFGQDRMTSAASGWAATIDEEDVTTLLPHPLGAPDTSDDPLSSPLCIHNPSFFFANPPHLVKRLQLHFKAFVLLGRVTRFLQRAPSPIGAGYPRKPGDPDIRETSEFRSLDRTISHFSLSIPRGLQYSYYAEQSLLMEMTPLMAWTIVHVCVILMHEPFCLAPTIDASDPSFKRCLEAAKAIVASVHELSGSSFETGLLYSFLNWLWAIAGRTLVRALALASRRGDLISASQLAQDVQALITAMRANRSPVGTVTAHNLQRLLASPFQVLNEAFTGSGDYPHAEDSAELAGGNGGGRAGSRSSGTGTPAALDEMEELAQAILKGAVGDSWGFGTGTGDRGAFFP